MLKFHEGRQDRNSICSEFSVDENKNGSMNKSGFDATKGNSPEKKDYGDGIIRIQKPAYNDFGAFPKTRNNHHTKDTAYRAINDPNDGRSPKKTDREKKSVVENNENITPNDKPTSIKKPISIISQRKSLNSQQGKSIEKKSSVRNDPNKKLIYNTNDMQVAGLFDGNRKRPKTMDVKPVTYNGSECVYNTGYCPEPDHDLKHFIKARATKYRGETVTITAHQKQGNIIPKDWSKMPAKKQQYLTDKDQNGNPENPNSHAERLQNTR